MVVTTCDGCGKQFAETEQEADLEPLMGFHGTVWQISGCGGSGSVDWYACKERCIAKAVKTAVARAWD